MSAEEIEGLLKRVANMLASVTIYSESPTYVDRFSNALSKEAVAKVVYESQRVLQVGISNGDIKLSSVKIKEGKVEESKEGEGGESYPAISIKTKEREYYIVGYLPTDKDVEDFLRLVEKDVYYARKAGALAMSIANKTLLAGGSS
jgi:CRISPR type I-A-associated protein Csa5